ncbi:toll/interleukin-1 receptor domain-containing protein [Ideonella sp. YS5]|uniref:toll/interleukin-1 receptor domain-containing protein n=1 Tax=Ideonella sp. YS5 TaxID=3453714 RepID=UPI003EED1AAE
MGAIFISYRRSDAEGQAGRLFKDLQERFGPEAVFMDVVDIEPGRDFRRVIDQQVSHCGVLLALIGPRWLEAADDKGQRRLDDAGDYVRLETAAALKRDIPVVPVLVQGARMPSAGQLPADVSDLAYRNAVELTHARWDSDVEVLARALEPHVTDRAAGRQGAPVPRPEPDAGQAGRAVRWPWIAGPLVLLAMAGGWFAYERSRQAAGGATLPPQRVSFQGRVPGLDPCNGQRFRTTGTTSLTVTGNAQGGVVVEEQYEGSGSGYTVRFSGRKSFDQRAAFYDIPIRGEWNGPDGSRFETHAVDRILTGPDGAPTGDAFQSDNSRCLSR